MMSRKVQVRVSRSTARWLAAGNNDDQERARYRGPTVGRMIRFWETIRNWPGWFTVSECGWRNGSDRRWMRRTLYAFVKAGLIESRKRKTFPQHMEFHILARSVSKTQRVRFG